MKIFYEKKKIGIFVLKVIKKKSYKKELKFSFIEIFF